MLNVSGQLMMMSSADVWRHSFSSVITAGCSYSGLQLCFSHISAAVQTTPNRQRFLISAAALCKVRPDIMFVLIL